MRKTAFIIFILSLAFGISCANDNGTKSLSVKRGAVFTITLRSNPTTGYSWKISKISDPLVIKSISSKYIPDKTDHGICGSGGREIWKFKANKCGKAFIEFSYQRPWEKNVPSIDKKKYLIKVIY
jgi:inhibitor of cysteine peptidase